MRRLEVPLTASQWEQVLALLQEVEFLPPDDDRHLEIAEELRRMFPRVPWAEVEAGEWWVAWVLTIPTRSFLPGTRK